MKHAETIQALDEAAAEIRPGTDVQAVLKKKASEYGMAPAELARLGQMFNVASTLAIYKEGGRGSKPELVDVPAMVDSYVEKQASFPEGVPVRAMEIPAVSLRNGKVVDEDYEAFLDLADMDGSEFFEGWGRKKAASAEESEPDVPDLWSAREELPEEPLFEPMEDANRTARRSRLFKRACALACREIGLAADAADEVLDEPREIVTGLVKNARISGDPGEFYSTISVDARGSLPPERAAAVSLILKRAMAREGLPTPDPDEKAASAIVVHRDRTGSLGDLVKLSGAFDTADALDRYGRGMLVGLADLTEAYSDVVDDEDVDLIGRAAARFGAVKKQAAAAAAPGGPSPVPPGADPALLYTQLQHELKQKKKLEKEVEKWREEQEKRVNELVGENTKLKDQKDEAAALDTAGRIFQNIEDRTRPSQERVRDQLGMLEEDIRRKRLEQGEEYNAKLDEHEDQTRAIVNLKRLMIQDDIVAEHDPEEVVGAFNSIRASAPRTASDYNLLRLALRNALETQGVDLDTALSASKLDEQIQKNEEAATPRSKAVSGKPNRKD